MGPVGRHIRSSLRRRIFWWFVAAIFATVGAVAVTLGVLWHLSGGQSRWSDPISRYVSSELPATWDQPQERDRRLAAAAEAFDVNLEVRAVDGTVISRVGDACPRAIMIA